MIARRPDYSPEVDAVLTAVLRAADGVDLRLLGLALLDQGGVSERLLDEVAAEVDREIATCPACGRIDRLCRSCYPFGLFERPEVAA